jgi:hypothetical protein
MMELVYPWRVARTRPSVCRHPGRQPAARTRRPAPASIPVVFRDPLSLRARTSAQAAVAMAAPVFPTTPRPLAPRPSVRYDDGILQIAAGDGLRVAVREIVDLELAPTAGARLRFAVTHRSGCATVRRSYSVPAAEHDGLQRLVATVRAGMTMRA